MLLELASVCLLPHFKITLGQIVYIPLRMCSRTPARSICQNERLKSHLTGGAKES